MLPIEQSMSHSVSESFWPGKFHSWRREFDLNETEVNQDLEDRHKEKMEGVQLVKARPSFNHNWNCFYVELCVHMDKYVVFVLTHLYGHSTYSCGHLKNACKRRQVLTNYST